MSRNGNQSGFEIATQSNIVNNLKSISPSGSTSLRDAILEGCTLLLSINSVLATQNLSDNFNFLHIVITDGDDCSSKASLEETCAVMYLINQTIPVHMLKTWFLGIGLSSNSNAAKEMMALCLTGGENTEYVPVQNLDISKVFERIRLDLGIVNHRTVLNVQGQGQGNQATVIMDENALVLSLQQKSLVVLFTLDMSGSMSGAPWKTVCSCVENFVSFLGPTDFVGGLVFNDKVQMVNKLGGNNYYISNLQQNSNNYQQQQLSNNYPQQKVTYIYKQPQSSSNNSVVPQKKNCCCTDICSVQ